MHQAHILMHFWIPPDAFLDPAGCIFGSRLMHFWIPPDVFPKAASLIFGSLTDAFLDPIVTTIDQKVDFFSLIRNIEQFNSVFLNH